MAANTDFTATNLDDLVEGLTALRDQLREQSVDTSDLTVVRDGAEGFISGISVRLVQATAVPDYVDPFADFVFHQGDDSPAHQVLSLGDSFLR